jgi:diguanylate cyclase
MAALFSGAMITAGFSLVAAALTVRASMRRPASGFRSAYRLLALGLLLGAIAVVATVHEMCRPGGVGRWTVLLVPLGAGLSLQALVLLAGVLRLARIADGRGAAIRRCTEGLVIASSAAYVAWTMLIQPLPIDNMNGRLTYADKVIGLLILTPSLLAIGICGTSAWRLRRGLGGLIALSVLATVATAALLLAAAGCGDAVVIAIASGLYALALAAVAICVHRLPAIRPATSVRTMSTGTLIAWVPISCAIAACIAQLVMRGRSDNAGILIAVVIGGALAARQTLSMHDVRIYATELERRERLYRELAHTDPLTELANRRSFVATLRERVVGGPPSAVLAIDLDGFKNVNDLRGHDVGDAVLVEVAHRLRTNLRPDDIPARLGGDEFAVVLWLRPAEAAAKAGGLRAVLSRPYEVGDSIVYLSASIGLAVTEGSADVPELMRNADVALRFAKLRGKDRVEGYAEAFVAWLRRRNTVEAELRGAIRRGELSLLYQPVVALPSGLVVGAEALLRWHNDDLGPVSPSEFIPIAEGSGLIDDIGRWVMAEACRQLSRWIVDGHALWLSVNVSVRELHRPDYGEQLADVIRTHHVPADRLVLEVTEHAVAIDMDVLVATLAALRETGLRIALDDFGAGYSSLGQLHQLPVDILKVDSSIVSPSPATADQAGQVGVLADVVVRLGGRLGLDVIAEGVADAEQRRVVEEAGCILVQGELFAWPVTPERLEELVANGPIVPAQRRPSEPSPPGTGAAGRAEAPGPAA